jgi:hypothetical protein
LVESFKLDPRALDEGPRLKSGELRRNLRGTSFGGKINWYGPKNKPKKKVHHLKNQNPNKARSNSKIQFASNGSKLVHVNLDPRPSSKVGLI